MIELKTPAEVQRMRTTGRFVAEALAEVARLADVGVNLLDLEHHVRTLVVHADLGDDATGLLNDMVVDAAGRCYVGNFGFDLMHGAPVAAAALHRVDPDGTVTEVAPELWFPNGSAITPEGTLLVNETFGNRISAFDVTPAGELANHRVWAEFGPLPGAVPLPDALSRIGVAPDGGCLDAAGGCCGSPRAGRSPTRCGRAPTSTPARWAEPMGGRCSRARRPTSTSRPGRRPGRQN